MNDNVLLRFYNRIRHLRYAKGILDDINILENAAANFDANSAIRIISRIVVKYEQGIEKIGFLLTGRPVIRGQAEELYADYNEENVYNDLMYLRDCLILIGVVKYGGNESLEDAINQLV